MSYLIVQNGKLCVFGGRLVTSEGGAPCVCEPQDCEAVIASLPDSLSLTVSGVQWCHPCEGGIPGDGGGLALFIYDPQGSGANGTFWLPKVAVVPGGAVFEDTYAVFTPITLYIIFPGNCRPAESGDLVTFPTPPDLSGTVGPLRVRVEVGCATVPGSNPSIVNGYTFLCTVVYLTSGPSVFQAIFAAGSGSSPFSGPHIFPNVNVCEAPEFGTMGTRVCTGTLEVVFP